MAALLLALLGWPPASQATTATSTTDTPLTVAIESLTPAVLKPTGPLRITGTVSNDSSSVWRDINLHPVTSHHPITTPDGVTEAAALADDAVFGDRITDDGAFDPLGELAPGEQARFSVKVPRDSLGIGSQPGVYLVGVHARATSDEGRQTAGMDRMFLPLVTEAGKFPVEASVVVPIRARVNRDADGHLLDLERWRQMLGRGGRLYDLLDLVNSNDAEVTWLVDPAVLAAVEQIALGNPGDLLVSVDQEGPSPAPDDATSTAQPSATADPSAVPVPTSLSPGAASDPSVDEELQQSAERWLGRATAALRDHQVLALPYGDVDVSGATAARSPLLARAAARGAKWLEDHEITSTPAVSPPNGRIRPEAFARVPRSTVVLVDRGQLTGADETTGETTDETDAAATDAAAAAEDPPPATLSRAAVNNRPLVVTDALTPDAQSEKTISLRQRILAEAAVRRQTGARDPLVVLLPDAWHPETTPDLLEGLDVPWLNRAEVHTTTAGATVLQPDDLSYPEAAAEQEVPSSRFGTALQVQGAAERLVKIIDGTSPYARDTERAVLTALSPLQSDDAGIAIELSTRNQTVLNLLGSIRIQAPPRVTLSSTTGQFPGTVENDLGVPVVVQVRPSTDGNLSLTSPGTLSVPANGRRTVRFEATSSKLGTHQVSLVITDTDGVPVGGRIDIPVRAGSVSVIVWWLMAGGAALLVLMILRQWRRRGLRRRATPLPDPDEGQPVAGHPPVADRAENGAENGAENVAEEGAGS